LLLTAAQGTQAAIGPGSGSDAADSFGVNIHFVEPAPGEMAATGVRWVRTDFSWAATERVKGEYDF